MAQIKTKAGGIMTFPTAIRVREGGVWKDCVGKIRESGVWNDVISYESSLCVGYDSNLIFIDPAANSGTLETLRKKSITLPVSSIHCIEMDDLKNLYVGGSRVLKLNSNGGIIWGFNPNTSEAIEAIAVDSNYNVYATAKKYYCKINPDGSLAWEKSLNDNSEHIVLNEAQDRLLIQDENTNGEDVIHLVDASNGAILYTNIVGQYADPVFENIRGIVMGKSYGADDRFTLIRSYREIDGAGIYRIHVNKGYIYSDDTIYINPSGFYLNNSVLASTYRSTVSTTEEFLLLVVSEYGKVYNLPNHGLQENHYLTIIPEDLTGTPQHFKMGFIIGSSDQGNDSLVKFDFDTGTMLYDIKPATGLSGSGNLVVSKYPKPLIFPDTWTTNKLW